MEALKFRLSWFYIGDDHSILRGAGSLCRVISNFCGLEHLFSSMFSQGRPSILKYSLFEYGGWPGLIRDPHQNVYVQVFGGHDINFKMPPPSESNGRSLINFKMFCKF